MANQRISQLLPSEQSSIMLNAPRLHRPISTALGGGFVLKALWDRLDLSLCFLRAGWRKNRGIPTWALGFLLVWGLYLNITGFSIRSLLVHARRDGLLSHLTGMAWNRWKKDAVYRFLQSPQRQWRRLLLVLLTEIQRLAPTLLEGPLCLAVDDSILAHSYAKRNPLLMWLYDASQKRKIQGMNLVAIVLILPHGGQLPLAFRYVDPDSSQTKYDLVLDMLKELQIQLPTADVTITMDSWYGASLPFLMQLSEQGFRWVTQGRRNFCFYRRAVQSKEPRRGRPREWDRCSVDELLSSPDPQWIVREDGSRVLDAGRLFLRRKVDGKMTTFPVRVLISRQADSDSIWILMTSEVEPPTDWVVDTYGRRWGIEVFFRRIKQTFHAGDCHLRYPAAVTGYTTLIFVADTLRTLTDHPAEGSTTEKGETGLSIFRTPCECRFRETEEGWELTPVFTDENTCLKTIQALWPKQVRLSLWDKSV